MIEVKGVGLSFDGNPVLENASFSLEENQFLAVIGPNGSGKSSLAYAIAGLVPDFIPAKLKGSIKCNGRIGVVMQNPSNQFFALTVKEELGNRESKGFNAGHLVEKSVFQLSEGEKQKINLISNLLDKVDVLLLDEPLELLDPREAKNFLDVLSSQKGKTVIWFDKDERFVKGKKIFYLKKPAKLKKKKRKKTHSLGSLAFSSQFSFSSNGFSLKEVNLSVKQGEKIALIGLNGSGKTTLLKCIAGIHKPKGKLKLFLPVGYCPQEPGHLLFKDTVREEATNKELFELFELQKIAGLDPAKASKGQQKLVSIASLPEKGLFLLDEPTTWLDAENKQRIYDFISASDNPMLIATHDPELIGFCDRVLLVNGGVKECSSTAAKQFFQNGLIQ